MQLVLSNARFENQAPEDFLALAATAKFDGVLLYGPYGLHDVGVWGGWLTTPALMKPACTLAGVRIAGLHAGPIDAMNARSAEALRARLMRCIEIAKLAECPHVLIGGRGPELASPDRVIAASLDAIAAALPAAAAAGVRVLVGPGGALRSTKMVWGLHDALGSDAVGLWIDPFLCQRHGESPSVSIKRLARGLCWVSLQDGLIDPATGRVEARDPGGGDGQTAFVMELLRGLAYSGVLAVDFDAEAHLPAVDALPQRAADWIRAELAKPTVVLAAYKGDRNAPRYRTAAGSAAAAAEAS